MGLCEVVTLVWRHLCCPQPPPHHPSQPQREHLSPQHPQKQPHHTMDWMSWLQAELGSLCIHWHILALFNFFLHKTASSVPRGGIGNGHFIYSCSGTPAEQCHSFLCMGMLRSPSAGAAVLLHTEYFDILVFWYSHLWSGFFRAPDTNLTPLPLKWAAFHPPLLLFALLRGLST